MKQIHTFKLTHNAQALRKNMTDEERHLWYDFLKGLPLTVNRQKIIGRYIVDFYCASAKLIIELDGSQHFEQENINADKERDAFFQSLALTVKRYSNVDIQQNFQGVCEDIYNYIFISGR